MAIKMILINTKAYERGVGRSLESLAKICKKFKNVSLAVQPTEIWRVAKYKVRVYAQDVDPVTYGAHTGWILPEAVKSAGAKGTLLNHSERKLKTSVLKKAISRCKSIELETIVCASSVREAKKIDLFHPDYIAIEPPELIGTGRSVSEVEPSIISRTVKSVRAKVLCGAGISTKEDVKKAYELGAVGVLVASAVLKSKNPRVEVRNLSRWRE